MFFNKLKEGLMDKKFLMKVCVMPVLISLFVAFGNSGEAITLVETYSFWDGRSYVIPFGEPDTATYGQVFMVPNNEDTALSNFSFWVESDNNNPIIDFKPYVYEWDGHKITGSALFEGPVMSTTNASGYQEILVNTGNVNLMPGQKYVAFFSASGLFGDGKDGRATFGAIYQSVYPYGEFVFFNNGNDFAKLYSSNWNCWSWDDLVFRFEFDNPQGRDVVPEPISVIMFGIGGLLGVGLKRKRKI